MYALRGFKYKKPASSRKPVFCSREEKPSFELKERARKTRFSVSYGFQPAICAINTQKALAITILPPETLPRCPPSVSVV